MREGGETFLWQNLVWLSDTNAWDDTCRGMSHSSRNWHMNDVDCDGILSCDCSEDEDSSERLMRLSVKDKDT